MAVDLDRIAAAIKQVTAGGCNDGYSGNCARFAIALNRALGGIGEYHIIDGDHPEYADHVLLMVGGAYYDASGRSTAVEIEAEWDAAPEYFGAEGEEASVLRLADDSGANSIPLDIDDLEAELREAIDVADAPSP